MKNLQKLAIIMLIMLMTLCFAACSSGTTDTGDTATDTGDTATDTGATTDTTTPAETQSITVGAAASLQGALTELGNAYMAANPGTKINFSFAGSGSLSKQIEEGAPMDMFVSASTKYITDLKGKELLNADSCKDILTNKLLLVAPADSTITSWDDLANVNKLAIGNPETAPVGKYAQEALTSLKLWDKFNGTDKLVLGKDVSEVMTYVKQDAVDAGIVYVSDLVEAQIAAKASGEELTVKSIGEAPADSYSTIKYGIALTKTESTLAQSFYDYLFTSDAGTVFTKYGFTPLSE